MLINVCSLVLIQFNSPSLSKKCLKHINNQVLHWVACSFIMMNPSPVVYLNLSHTVLLSLVSQCVLIHS